MTVDYTNSFNFKPISAITPLDGYWKNDTWKFEMPEISAGATYTPSWQDVILSGNTALTLVNAKEDGLNYLKLFGGCRQSNLSEGYTQVDGVTNSENGYINTNIIADVDDMEYDVVVKIISDYGSVSWYLLQSRADYLSSIYGITGPQNGNKITGAFSGINIESSINRTENHAYHVNFKCKNGNATLYVEDLTAGTNDTQTGTYTFSAAPTNIGLFSNISAAQFLTAGYTSVLSAYIKKSGVKVMDYISCKDSSSTAGFYDKVTNTFIGATSGSLQAGSDTVPSPSTPVDIICNNGVVKVKNLFNPQLYDAYKQTDNSYRAMASDVNSKKYYIPTELVGKTLTFSAYCDLTKEESPTAIRVMAFVNGTANSGVNIAANNKGISQITFVPTSTSDYIYISYGSGSNYYFTFKDIQLEFGSTATTYIPYGQIYTNGTTETVEVHGKNLFDENATDTSKGYITGGYLDSSGEFVGNGNYNTSVYVPVVSNTTYYYAIDGTDGTTTVQHSAPRIAYYDNNKNYISSSSTLSNGSNFTTPNNCWYIRIPIYRSALGHGIQLELGSTVTTYEAYFNGGSATAQDLYAVGTYKDVQSVLDGAVTRNVGIKVLDGTENWADHRSLAGWFQLAVSDCYDIPYNGYCTHYTYNSSSQTQAGVWFSTGRTDVPTSRIVIADNVRFPNTGMVTEFKAWLADQYAAGTPVIIVFPLASATTETVAGQTLTTQEGTNIVEITQASMNNLPLEVSYKAGVSVTVTEIENAQLDNRVEVTIQ